MSSKRTIFIGDIQGCFREFSELLVKLAPGSGDRVILLGDMINRGEESLKVIQKVHSAGYESLLGNHEANYLNKFQKSDKYRRLYREMGEELHQWLSGLPLFIETDDFIAVHGGLAPGLQPQDTPAEILLRIRTWDGSGKDLDNPDDPPWYELYKGTKLVIYGHWARQGLNVREKTIGLDSGCVYGGLLSAYILETSAIVQVKAHKRYYPVG